MYMYSYMYKKTTSRIAWGHRNMAANRHSVPGTDAEGMHLLQVL
jgi:hypothetical protein